MFPLGPWGPSTPATPWKEQIRNIKQTSRRFHQGEREGWYILELQGVLAGHEAPANLWDPVNKAKKVFYSANNYWWMRGHHCCYGRHVSDETLESLEIALHSRRVILLARSLHLHPEERKILFSLLAFRSHFSFRCFLFFYSSFVRW